MALGSSPSTKNLTKDVSGVEFHIKKQPRPGIVPVDKVLVMHAWRPELDPWNPCKRRGENQPKLSSDFTYTVT